MYAKQGKNSVSYRIGRIANELKNSRIGQLANFEENNFTIKLSLNTMFLFRYHFFVDNYFQRDFPGAFLLYFCWLW